MVATASRVLVAVLLLSAFSPNGWSQDVDNRPNLGMNLFFHTDYNNSFAFTDIVRRARNWGSVQEPFTPITEVDSFGWPTRDAGLFLHVSLDDTPTGALIPGPAPLPAGTYRIIFNGRAAEILPSIGTISQLRHDDASNTSRADWTLAPGDPRHENVTVAFMQTQRSATAAVNTGLTNLRIYLPGFPDDGSVVFTPEFLTIARNFGIIRFMDWVDANKNPLVNFSDRVTPAHASYNLSVGSDDLQDLNFTQPLRGVAIEHMVQLCNETDSDMWINVPARASDDCVRQMLLLIKDGGGGFAGLEPERRLYIEYGNEVWNSLGAFFQCFPRVSALAQSALQNDRAHPINFDGLLASSSPDILTAPGDQLIGEEPFVASQMRHRFVAFRIKAISDIAREVFGPDQMMSRVRPILASQFGDGQTTFSAGLRFLDEFAGVVRPTNPVARRVNEIIFGGGGAAYSTGNNSSRDAYFGNFPQPEFVTSARTDAVLARGYGIRYVAYEGGPSLGDPQTGEGGDAQTERLFLADTRVRRALVDSHNDWMQAGGDIFVYYVLTGDPTFEFAGRDGDSSSQKMLGYNDVRRQPSLPVTTGTLVPSTFPAGSAAHSLNEGSSIQVGGAVLLNAQSFVGRSQFMVPVRTLDEAPPPMTISVEVDATDRGDSSLDVFLNGVSLGTIPVVANTRQFINPLENLPNRTVSMQRGLNVITLRANQGQTLVRNIRVEADPVWDEANDGSLSPEQANPSVLPLHGGGNSIVGSVGGGAGQANPDDHFTFTIPPGSVLQAFTLASYASTDPRGWIGLQNGTPWTAGDNSAINPALLRANQHFGTANVGQGLLGISRNAPLPAGTYTVKIQQFGERSDYRLELTMANAALAPAIRGLANASGRVGNPFVYNITARNTPTGYAADGMPPGLGINGTTGVISGRPTRAGTFDVRLTATNAGGNGTATLRISVAKGTQTITFRPAATQKFKKGRKFTLSATATSKLPVSFKSSNTKILSIKGRTATIRAKGKVTVTAVQGGNANYLPAKAVKRTITIK